MAWNLAGLSIPLFIAAASVPCLLTEVGSERFGVLALAWALIGYAGLLDFGIGRALTKITSSMIGSNDHSNIPNALHTGIRLTIAVSVVGSAFICVAAILGATKYLKVDNIPQNELILSAVLLALALPLQALSATYKGVNEAFLNFRAISVIRVILGASTFGLPLLIAVYSVKMHMLIGSIVISRAFALLFYRYYAAKCISYITITKAHFSRRLRNEMLMFGGWYSVSNTINPIVGSLDRIFIGSIVSSAAITVYVIPYEVTTQTLVLVGSITTVGFPYLTAIIAREPQKANIYFTKLLVVTTLIMASVAILQYSFGGNLLQMWLGGHLRNESSVVIKILAIGLVPYTVGTMSTALLHSYGRTDLTAKIHLVGLVIFIPLIYYYILMEGVIGAAKAWVVRVSIDAAAIAFITFRVAIKTR